MRLVLVAVRETKGNVSTFDNSVDSLDHAAAEHPYTALTSLERRVGLWKERATSRRVIATSVSDIVIEFNSLCPRIIY